MKHIFLNKPSKKIKVKLLSKNNLEISGPLGSVLIEDTNIMQLENKSLYIPQKKINILVNNIKKSFIGISRGWFIELNLKGLGFKIFKINDNIAFDLGYSSLILFKPIPKLKIKNFKGKLLLFSIEKELLNTAAFLIKNLTKIDLYKGKGFSLKNKELKLKKKNKL